MRFIHTSDWHIGRLFQNISLLDDQVHVLKQISDYVNRYKVDALIISGDIFDRSIPPAEAVDVLDKFFTEIAIDLQLPIILISGNHDSAKRLRFGAKNMSQSGLHILADVNQIETPIILKRGEQEVAFYGIPYHDPVEVREAFRHDENIGTVKTYDQAHTLLANKILSHKQKHHGNTPAVLLSHCFIDGASESDSERPLSIGGADRVSWQPLTDFSYVALGHLHAPQYKGQESIRYSGSLLKYSFSEYKQKKAVTLVDISIDGSISTEQLPLVPKHDLRIIEGELEALIAAGKTDPNNQDYILAKVTDTQVILDPMGRLRSVYPNVLQLERTNFDNISGSRLTNSTTENGKNIKSEEEVFSDFFTQVMDGELTAEQQSLLLKTIGEARAQMEQK